MKARALTSLAMLACLSGCYIPITRTTTQPLPVELLVSRTTDTTVAHPVRVTRLDGSVVEFPAGSLMGSDGIWARFEITRTRQLVDHTPLDSISHILVIRRDVRPIPTAIVSTVASTAGYTAVNLLVLAFLGSLFR